MPRPKTRRRIRFSPNVYYFKPRGVPMRILEEVVIANDELEALKLHEVDRLDQMQAAVKMKISQPTFARIIGSANRKLAKAIISGMAIRIERGGERT